MPLTLPALNFCSTEWNRPYADVNGTAQDGCNTRNTHQAHQQVCRTAIHKPWPHWRKPYPNGGRDTQSSRAHHDQAGSEVHQRSRTDMVAGPARSGLIISRRNKTGIRKYVRAIKDKLYPQQRSWKWPGIYRSGQNDHVELFGAHHHGQRDATQELNSNDGDEDTGPHRVAQALCAATQTNRCCNLLARCATSMAPGSYRPMIMEASTAKYMKEAGYTTFHAVLTPGSANKW